MSGSRPLEGNQYNLDLPRGSTIKALRYLRDGRLFAVSTLKHGPPQELNGVANVVQVWEIGRSTPLCEFVTVRDGCNRVVIHPEGSRIAISTDDDLSIWAVPSGQHLWEVRPGTLANDIEFSPDGQLLTTVGPYGPRDNLAVVDLWNSESGANLFSISPGIQSCDFAAFSPDGLKLAVSGIHEDPSIGSLFIWTTDGRNLVSQEHERGGQSAICFSPDGRFVATSDGTIHFWDAESGDLVRVVKAKSGEVLGGILFDPHGSTLITTAKRLETIDSDVSDVQLLKVFAEDANPFETLILRQVEKLTGKQLTFGDVVRLETESGRELDRRPIHLSHPTQGSGYYGYGATVSPDGSQFAMALHTSVEVWRFDYHSRD